MQGDEPLVRLGHSRLRHDDRSCHGNPEAGGRHRRRRQWRPRSTMPIASSSCQATTWRSGAGAASGVQAYPQAAEPAAKTVRFAIHPVTRTSARPHERTAREAKVPTTSCSKWTRSTTTSPRPMSSSSSAPTTSSIQPAQEGSELADRGHASSRSLEGQAGLRLQAWTGHPFFRH